MGATEIVSYATISTAGLTMLYITVLTFEVKRGKRIGEKFRKHLDKKMYALIRRVGRNIGVLKKLYERGSNEVEKDLINPATRPITEARQKYAILKTGKRKIRRAGRLKASPHIQEMLIHKDRVESKTTPNANKKNNQKTTERARKEKVEGET